MVRDGRQIGGACARQVARGVLVLLLGMAGLGADCVDTSSAGDAGQPPATQDVGGASDAGAGSCRGVATADVCRQRSGCQWLTATCDGGRVVGGCFAGSGWVDADFDCSERSDAGGAGKDAGTAGCGAVSDEATCQGRDACRWWTARCGDQIVDARCIDRDISPESPDCPALDAAGYDAAGDAGAVDAADGGVDAGADAGGGSDAVASDAELDADVHCRMHSNSSDCKSDSRCQWWVDECDGYVIEEACVAADESPTATECRKIPPKECHDIDGEDACRPPNCAWVAEGCGSSPVGSVELTACLPQGTCNSNSDCPTRHKCVHLWADVCYGSACQACGGETTRCVPVDLLKP